MWRGKLSTPQWRRNEMGGKHMLIDSLDRELRGSTTNLSRFSEERRAVSIVEGKAVNASMALSRSITRAKPTGNSNRNPAGGDVPPLSVSVPYANADCVSTWNLSVSAFPTCQSRQSYGPQGFYFHKNFFFFEMVAPWFAR